MKQSTGLDRRRFVQAVGGAALSGAVGSRSGWAATLGTSKSTTRFVYIGDGQGIHVYSLDANEHFIEQQTISSAHPAAMAIGGGNLFVANGVSEYGGLPRGSLEAYAIDAGTGHLVLANRVPLSLSAISPRALAVAPNGRSIVVAVHGGGAYNVLSVHESGRLGSVSSILKETGSGPHVLQASAHPSAVMFDPAGRVLATDQGSDKLNVLLLTNGELTVTGRREVTAGSGPTNMALAPDGKRLYVAHAFDGSISAFEYDARVGRILDRKQTVWALGDGEIAALQMHPSGKMLYGTHGNGVQAWKTAADGSLAAVSGMEPVHMHKLHVTADGRNLFALTGDGVLRMRIDAATYALGAPVEVAAISKPDSIAIL